MFLSKLIGAVCIIGATSLYGYSMTKELDSRLNALAQLKRAFLLLRSEIRFSLETLPDAFIRVAVRMNNNEDRIRNFFESVANRLIEEKEKDFKDIWKEEVLNLKPRAYLDGKDEDKLNNMAEGLGYLDVTHQLNAIDQYIELLDADITELSGKYKDTCKLYTSLGIMSGLFLTILLV